MIEKYFSKYNENGVISYETMDVIYNNPEILVSLQGTVKIIYKSLKFLIEGGDRIVIWMSI